MNEDHKIIETQFPRPVTMTVTVTLLCHPGLIRTLKGESSTLQRRDKQMLIPDLFTEVLRFLNLCFW